MELEVWAFLWQYPLTGTLFLTLTKVKTMDQFDYKEKGKELRREIVEIMGKAGRGHVGSAFSVVEILLVLYHRILNINPKNPSWDGRDRFILSKGHSCLALYPILAELGFFPREELYQFCSPEGILGGHPDHLKVPGVEASTGALGHGLSIGIGMAVRAKMDKLPYRVFVVLGDGECNEGTIWEGALSAAKHKLDNLFVLVDYNKYQSYASIEEVLPLEPFAKKWEAFGHEVHEVDMDYPENLEKLLQRKMQERGGKPVAVICHTIKGKGTPLTEGNMNWHHKNKLSPDEYSQLMKALS